MANLMESKGATVFAFTPNGEGVYLGASLPHQRFHVWAKVDNDNKIGSVNDAIDGALDPPRQVKL